MSRFGELVGHLTTLFILHTPDLFRYLKELGTLKQCLKLLSVAYRTCDNKKSLLYATLLNTAAAVEEKRNHSDTALELHTIAREVREALLPADHEELANTYNNSSMSLMSKLRLEEAEDLLLRALSIDFQKPAEAQKKILHTRYLNLGLLYTLMGRFHEARENIKMAEEFVISNFGEGSYYIAT